MSASLRAAHAAAALDAAELGFRQPWRHARELRAEGADACQRGARGASAIKRLTFRQRRADPARVLFHLQAGGARDCSFRRPMCGRSGSSTTCRAAIATRIRRGSCRICASSTRSRASTCRNGSSSGRAAGAGAGHQNKTATHDHLSPEGWEDLPGGGAEALLQRDPDQGELALRALRLRPGGLAGDAASSATTGCTTWPRSSRCACRAGATCGAC